MKKEKERGKEWGKDKEEKKRRRKTYHCGPWDVTIALGRVAGRKKKKKKR
jgi:hypothetical protein